MLNDLDELLVDLDVLRTHVLAVLEGDLDAELVQLCLLVLVETPVLERRIFGFELLEQAVVSSHFFYF